MRKVKINLVLLTLLLSAGIKISYGQQRAVQVTGRAIDERGAPISDAIVTLYYPPCRDCIDHILPVSFSLPDGVFFINYMGMSLRGLKLYLSERTPKGFWSPVDDAPPFDKMSHLRQFKGIPIRPRKGKVRVDLGDVLVRVRYSKVTIELPKVLGEKYKPSQEASRLLNFTLRDSQGKVIYDGRLPEVTFDPTFSSVNLALTKGRWILEFSLDSQNQRIRSPRLFIDINSLGCTKITLSAGKQSDYPCN